MLARPFKVHLSNDRLLRSVSISDRSPIYKKANTDGDRRSIGKQTIYYLAP